MERWMRWSESIRIAAPSGRVYSAVRDQHTLMTWSAWPEATGFTCRVDGDGLSPGSQIVFTDSDGVEQGRQNLWLTRSIRPLHVKDLQQLKTLVESRRVD